MRFLRASSSSGVGGEARAGRPCQPLHDAPSSGCRSMSAIRNLCTSMMPMYTALLCVMCVGVRASETGGRASKGEGGDAQGENAVSPGRNAPENSRRQATRTSHRLSSSTPYPPAGILGGGCGFACVSKGADAVSSPSLSPSVGGGGEQRAFPMSNEQTTEEGRRRRGCDGRCRAESRLLFGALRGRC